MDDDAQTPSLDREVLKQMVLAKEPPPRFVLFVDMLGFSRLTEDHPNATVYDFDSGDLYTAVTSESASQIGRFQHVLNSVHGGQIEGLAPYT